MVYGVNNLLLSDEMPSLFYVWALLQKLKEDMSTDADTQVGAVIVDATGKLIAAGANHHTFGMIATETNSTRPVKYDYIEHAERSAIYTAARLGMPLEGVAMYMEGFPCVECARAIVQSGIAELYHGSIEGFDPVKYKFDKASEILDAGGVECVDWTEAMNNQRRTYVS